ncbi:NEW3 domain-containing protein [Bacillus sinesaloumensis]|uniref:COG1470 family protein n=1 Tax=Litchfieldia sinesaloumensis TaxID=1926280 RepID=UPI0009885BFA|nr:NEW3 domain-containing protein [Bacillus sinesaloumensis]
MNKKMIFIFSFIVLFMALMNVGKVHAVENVTLFTPYTGLSATPGETITYSVNVTNTGSSIQNMSFDFENIPKDWDYSITSGGRDIRELSVKGNSEETLNVDISIPLNAKKADYRFNLVASDNGSNSKLPLLITLSEQGSFESELTSDQKNLQGHADSNFTYTVKLRNRTAEQQNYALSSAADKGWGVRFKSGSDSISSITIEPNESKDITVEVTPPEKVEAGSFKIPISASTGSTSAEITLDAVITGSYGIEISTPTGNLSTDITAGDNRVVDLVIKNTGTAPLLDVNITSNTPPKWETEFDTSSISELKPGESKTVKATITAPDEAIAGDYVTTFSASAAEASSDATFRVSVETSTLWGAVAILIILGVLGGLYYIFRKYGRR